MSEEEDDSGKEGEIERPLDSQENHLDSLSGSEIQPVGRNVRFTSWRSPLPLPEHVEQYNNTLPGAAERIFNMAERQQEHRFRMEEQIVHLSNKGRISGLVISLAVVACSAYAIYAGYPWAAVAMISANLAGLAGVFVYGKRDSSSRGRKDDDDFS